MTKRLRQITDVVVRFIGVFVGTAILAWGIGQLRLARASRDWPRVEGRVTSSYIEDNRRWGTARVEYAYSVAGSRYTSRQISFDLFNGPGGYGRARSIVARYPVRRKVLVYYAPGRPATAIVEPEVYSPFFMPLVLAAWCLVASSIGLVRTINHMMFGTPRPYTRARRYAIGSRVAACLCYVLLITFSFGSGARETFVRVFGERPAGIPNIVFVISLETLLFLPIPWVLWHAGRLAAHAPTDDVCSEYSFGLAMMVAGERDRLRRSRTICLSGLLYVFIIFAGCFVYSILCDL
jgi:hypothetical protein